VGGTTHLLKNGAKTTKLKYNNKTALVYCGM